jgi:hypothetical protein
MAKFTAQPDDVVAIERYLHEEAGLRHLRLRRRADVVVIESGPSDDPVPHARLRRVSAPDWRLEMATHTGRWEETPLQGPRDDVIRMLVEDFGWALEPVE